MPKRGLYGTGEDEPKRVGLYGTQTAPGQGLAPQVPVAQSGAPGFGSNIPNGYTSPDVEDRRNGTGWMQGMLGQAAAKAHQLIGSVQDDYADSFGPKNLTVADIPDVSTMKATRKTQ